MRIAFILGTFPVLSETFVIDQITGLLDRGHQVDIYARHGPTRHPMHEAVEAYDLPDRTIAPPAIPRRWISRAIRGVRLLAQAAPGDRAVLVRTLNAVHYGRRALSLGLMYRAFPFLGKRPYDIIHAHHGPAGELAVLLRAAGAVQGVLVTTFHGHDANVRPRRYATNHYEMLFREGEACIVYSEFMARRLLALGASEDRLTVLPPGIDLSRFAYRVHSYEPGQDVRLLTVARLEEVKGIGFALQAVARLRGEGFPIRYQIVGDGPLREALGRQVIELGIGDAVEFLGALPREEVIQAYGRAHLFCLPGIIARDGAQEAFGLVLLEAQATGLPVIASRVGGIPELIEDQRSGLLVPQQEVDALANALRGLIQHPERWPAMGEAGHAYITTHFDQITQINRLVAFYERLIS